MVCKKPAQVKVLDTIEANARTMQFVNKSGNLITKHKATLGQFGVLNVGLIKF